MSALSVHKLTALWFILGVIALICVRLLLPVNADVTSWESQKDQGRVGVWQPNTVLDQIETDVKGIEAHDSVVVDRFNRRYAGLNNGRLIRWEQNGEIEELLQLHGRPMGMTMDSADNLYIVEEKEGELWKISPDMKVIKLPTYGVGSLRYLNDVAVTQDDRSVFVTQSSTRWPFYYTTRAVLEHKNDGAVYMWPPGLKPIKLADNMSFPNGIVVSHSQDAVIVAETNEYRITRIWINGPRQGEKEVLIDNLPGFPSDLALANDGKHYWGVFFDYRCNKPLLDRLADKPFLRRLVINFPLSWFPRDKGTPTVFLFNEQGVVKTFHASSGSIIPGFSSVTQAGNELVLSTASPLHHDYKHRVFRINVNTLMSQ